MLEVHSTSIPTAVWRQRSCAYRTHGFYVFENVVTPDEISQLRRAVNDVIDRARLDPNPNSTCRAASDRPRPRHRAVRVGEATVGSVGRHHAACRPPPTKMAEPTAASDAPEYIVHLIFGMCMLMPEAFASTGIPACWPLLRRSTATTSFPTTTRFS